MLVSIYNAASVLLQLRLYVPMQQPLSHGVDVLYGKLLNLLLHLVVDLHPWRGQVGQHLKKILRWRDHRPLIWLKNTSFQNNTPPPFRLQEGC
jgi:hypothetical protein